MIRLTVPSIGEEELEAVRKVLESGFLVQGKNVAAFEKAVAEYVGCKNAIAVSNCTAALHLSLKVLGVGPGDIVVTTAYSFVATANAIELCGATPIFVDIRSDTFNMDPDYLEDALNQLMGDKKTANRVKAVLPVHTFGQMADMQKIMSIVNRYGIPVIEDAACALGAKMNGRAAGTWGEMGCFSFHPRKAITTGEGGVITTDNDDYALHLRALRNHGMDSKTSVPDFIIPGFNYRMTDFQAAMGVVQMGKLDGIIAARRKRARIYNSLLGNCPVKVPAELPGSEPVFQSYVVILDSKSGISRDELVQRLAAEDVESAIGTYNMPLTRYYRTRYGYSETEHVTSAEVFRKSLSLPLYQDLMEVDQERVVCLLQKFLGQDTYR